jgi:hypothetical protein
MSAGLRIGHVHYRTPSKPLPSWQMVPLVLVFFVIGFPALVGWEIGRALFNILWRRIRWWSC